MCRAGGRRCEHNWSEAQHKADLARRRAIYAKKAGQVSNAQTEDSVLTQAKLQSLMSGAVTETPTCETSAAQLTPVKKSPAFVTGMTKDQQDCNLSYKYYTKVSFVSDSEATYEMREFEAYSSEVITGKIIPEKLNTKSYAAFGFEDAKRWSKDVSDDYADHKAEATSLLELQALTLHEQTALAVFTTNSYTTINRYLHESPRAQQLKADSPDTQWSDPNSPYVKKTLEEEYEDFVTSDDDEQKFSQQLACARSYARELNVGNSNISTSFLTTYVDTVDTAFSKADGRQRIVYRGEKFETDNSRFSGYASVKEYANTHYSIGNTISFKGMQSTSSDGRPAKSYADSYTGSGGILYEISSPSGIALTSVSEYSGEKEVLLPRNSRYVVVGKKYVKGKRNQDIAVIQMVEVDENDNIRHAGNLRKKDEFGAFDASRFVDKSE